MPKNQIFLLVVWLCQGAIFAQETFPVNDVADQRSRAYALTGATIVVDAETTITKGTLLMRDGRIEQVGSDLTFDGDYAVIDMTGKTLYPSFIELYTGYGLPKPTKPKPFSFSSPEQIEPDNSAATNANEAIRSQYQAVHHFKPNSKQAKAWRGLGFGVVLSSMADGLARGSATLVTLGEGTPNQEVVIPEAATSFSFDKGSSGQSFPISGMGMVSLLRQTFLDAAWYESLKTKPFTDLSLEALNQNKALPKLFDTRDWMALLRAHHFGKELGISWVHLGSGDEYQRVDIFKTLNSPVVIPIRFPDAPNVTDPYQAERVSLSEMKHWELAAQNPAILERNDVAFALTTKGFNDTNRKTFWKNLRKAMKHGLSEKAALKALTSRPARMIGAEDHVGSLKAGRLANIVVTDGPIFDKDSTIKEHWIRGQRYSHAEPDHADLRGSYDLRVGENRYSLQISGSDDSPKAHIPKGKDDQIKVKLDVDDQQVQLSFKAEKPKGLVDLGGWIDGRDLRGRGKTANGTWVAWRAEYKGPPKEKKKKDKAKKGEASQGAAKVAEYQAVYPFSSYGHSSQPSQANIVFRNATVWTNEAEGILEDADVWVKNGKIAAVGKDLAAAGATEIDASGKHITAGIVDEHSHIALHSVNDVATNSGMVRMADVVDSEDINIYRNLAGGVTTAQLLHGSANPIGGQSAIVKMRWGADPRGMLVDGAAPFIKFALGENVKRSWNASSRRYPQTRMGVEQVYRDAFSQARDYQRAWQDWHRMSSSDKAKAIPPRRDLAMDTMVEILEGKRFISCHSYVQSEINMLMKVAEDFGFKVNTFTHILEGYKVADKMAAHGAGGSTFADWWAYKWEVRYAIPYNPALMQRAGVVVAVNSDDAEMSRRLNQEAAKSVKYGGMSEEEALKLVTLNPAKLLHLDDRMGSLKVGKDGDLVLWTDHPLSIRAKAEKTLVDGRVYFDLAQDEAKRPKIRAERQRLIAKIKAEGNGGGSSQGSYKPKFHCDFLGMEVHHD